ncbi:MAG: hypothetical protein FWG03_05710 [Clostridiales bacterium]|nr:hypothetical protein [Clostridiales bacterium]
MINRNEENFKNALKTLVLAEPEKLAYFSEHEINIRVPQFVPDRKQVSNTRKRRQYSYSMAAAAACFVVFASVAAYGFAPGTSGGGLPGPDEGAGMETAVPAPVGISQEAGDGDEDPVSKESVTLAPVLEDAIEKADPELQIGGETEAAGTEATASYVFEKSRRTPVIPIAIAIAAAALFAIFFVKRKRLGLYI